MIRQRGDFRLVWAQRDQKKWPLVGDLVLERRSTDALGVEKWDQITSKCIGTLDRDIYVKEDLADDVILTLLLTEWPVQARHPFELPTVTMERT